MGIEQDDMYYKGYIAGYRDGIRDASCGKTPDMVEQDIRHLPIETMKLSVRAYNCLMRADCTYIGDVVMLNKYKITATRGMGSKTASEIAHWLDDHGICYTEWSAYL